eukprot:gene3707-4055_t
MIASLVLWRITCLASLLPVLIFSELLRREHESEMTDHHHNTRRYAGTKLYSLENSVQEEVAYHKLVDAIKALKLGIATPAKNNFEDILSSVLLESHLVPNTEDKFIIGPNAITSLGKNFVVYAAGIANDPSFEEYMASLGAEVHGFDCTIPRGNPRWRMHYHPWCIGKEKGLDSSSYTNGVKGREMKFHRLGEIRQLLNHTHVDMFKFDIEGCEWDLIYDEIIHGNEADLPTQLLFELHTQGANPRWVPRDIVQGKGRQEVDQLILDLFHLGYRVFHLQMNSGDHYCAEISFYRVV